MGDVTLTALACDEPEYGLFQAAAPSPAALRQRAKAASRCRWVERAGRLLVVGTKRLRTVEKAATKRSNTFEDDDRRPVGQRLQ